MCWPSVKCQCSACWRNSYACPVTQTTMHCNPHHKMYHHDVPCRVLERAAYNVTQRLLSRGNWVLSCLRCVVTCLLRILLAPSLAPRPEHLTRRSHERAAAVCACQPEWGSAFSSCACTGTRVRASVSTSVRALLLPWQPPPTLVARCGPGPTRAIHRFIEGGPGTLAA
jgi:hypothetical protein